MSTPVFDGTGAVVDHADDLDLGTVEALYDVVDGWRLDDTFDRMTGREAVDWIAQALASTAAGKPISAFDERVPNVCP